MKKKTIYLLNTISIAWCDKHSRYEIKATKPMASKSTCIVSERKQKILSDIISDIELIGLSNSFQISHLQPVAFDRQSDFSHAPTQKRIEYAFSEYNWSDTHSNHPKLIRNWSEILSKLIRNRTEIALIRSWFNW